MSTRHLARVARASIFFAALVAGLLSEASAQAPTVTYTDIPVYRQAKAEYTRLQ